MERVARGLLKQTWMRPNRRWIARIKLSAGRLLAALQRLIAPAPELTPVPIRTPHQKAVESWQNEGGH